MLENETTPINSRFNSNNLLSSDASIASTSGTSLHEPFSSSNSSSFGPGSATPWNLLSNSSTFDDQHLRPSTSGIGRRNSSENSNKLNPNSLLYRQSRSLSNSAHSQEIEDQLLEKSFYSQPSLLGKNTVSSLGC